jgi:hypothetical protein
MHFANARSLTIMIVAWLVLLGAYDQHANPRPLSAYWDEFTASKPKRVEESTSDHPRLRVVMPRLCCEDCVGAVADTLRRFEWLGPADVRAREVLFDIRDAEHADLAAIDVALSSRGLVPDSVELFGLGHFRLGVELGSTFSCAGVSEDYERFIRKESQDRWLDSIVVNPKDDRSMLVYVRLNAIVDVMDLSRGLARAGLAIRSIEIRTGPE